MEPSLDVAAVKTVSSLSSHQNDSEPEPLGNPNTCCLLVSPIAVTSILSVEKSRDHERKPATLIALPLPLVAR